jgi:predicted DNA-binding transcriptional regulator AlpA
VRTAIRTSSEPDYLLIGDLCRRFNTSRMTIWRRMRDQQFPQPIRFGGPKSPRYWKRADVEAWETERVQ